MSVAGPDARPDARLVATRFLWVAALVALDLWSKAAAFAWLGRLDQRGELVGHDCPLLSHPRYPLSGDWLAFMHSENPGAAFGKLGDWPYVLVCGRVAAALFLVWLIARASRARPWTTLAFVLILGGALGNLYDNLFLDKPADAHPFGLVRDFIDVYFGFSEWHFPTFNVADSCITVGATILVVAGLFGRSTERAPEPAGQA